MIKEERKMWLKYINEALTGTSNATNFRPYINDLTLAVQKALVHFAPIERADYENNPFQLIDFFSGAGGTSLGCAALNRVLPAFKMLGGCDIKCICPCQRINLLLQLLNFLRILFR